jgi:hypothetical protein
MPIPPRPVPPYPHHRIRHQQRLLHQPRITRL